MQEGTAVEPEDQSVRGDERVTEAYREVSREQIGQWVEQFDRDGFLFLPEVLNPALVEVLARDLDEALLGREPDGTGLAIHTRMFESSAANVSLFDMEPMATFAETLVAPNCHVIHNNSFKTFPGGGISSWHQDDQPHYLVTGGEAPVNVRLPVLFFTANYYLTDVDTLENGPTQAIPGSHLFGKSCRHPLDPEHEALARSCPGKAGGVVLFNNQVWHRGAPNSSERTRYMTQVTYGRRIIGSMYYPFMNYVMPEHVYRDANPRLKRLLGFLPSGNYG